MDFIFFSSIMFVVVLHLAISYDIVCQWKINLAARNTKLPPQIQQAESDRQPLAERLAFGLPVWHAAAHEDTCQVTNSLRYQPGMGHTDGEGIERGWSRINPHASSTKEMGQGARHDALDDVFSHHNWERNIGLGEFDTPFPLTGFLRYTDDTCRGCPFTETHYREGGAGRAG